MDMKPTKVLPKLLLFLQPNILEVLIPKHHHTSLGHEQCEFVLLCIGKLGELEPFNLGPDSGCQTSDLDAGIACLEQVRFGFVCFESTMNGLEWLDWRKSGGLVVHRQVVGILVSRVYISVEGGLQADSASGA